MRLISGSLSAFVGPCSRSVSEP